MKNNHLAVSKTLFSNTFSNGLLSKFFVFFILFYSFNSASAGDLTVNATTSTGGALTGAKYQLFSGPNYLGESAVGTTLSLTTGTTYTFFVHYSGTSTKRETFVSSAGGNTYSFKTTNVKFNFSGGYLDYTASGGLISFGKTAGVWNAQELFPKDYYGNTMTIHTGFVWYDVRGLNFTIDYEGMTSIDKTITILRVFNSTASPISGVSFRGGPVTGTNWYVPGTTGATGMLAALYNGSPSSIAHEARVNGTTAVVGPQNPTTNSYYLFQTNKLTLRLQKCDLTGLTGGTVRWGYGATWGTSYFPAPNSTNASGETCAEFFPGTYSFEMNYQSTAQVKGSVVIPNANTILTWTTTKVILAWAYDIAYGGSGDSRYFNKPYMELLPGTYNFNFRSPSGSNYIALTFSGCTYDNKPVLVRLINSSGAGLSGGIVNYYISSTVYGGITNASGNLFLLLPASATSAYFSMNYNFGNYTIYQNIVTTPTVVFQTKNVVMELRDNLGALLSDATNLSYYQYATNTFSAGVTLGGVATMQLLPGSYYFNMQFNSGRMTIYQNIGTTPIVTFQTKKVDLELRDHVGALLSDATNLSYYQFTTAIFAGGVTLGGTATMQLLPGSYYFNMQFKSGRMTIYQNIGTTPTVTFQTKKVDLELRDHNGDLLSDATGLTYYQFETATFAGGVTVGGTATMQLLPGNYYFNIAFNSGRSSIYQNIGTTPTVTFTTTLTTVTLKDGAASPLSSGVVTDYQYFTNSFGTTDINGEVSQELLPGSYYFTLGYSATSLSKYRTVSGTTYTIDFLWSGSALSKTTGMAQNGTNNKIGLGVNYPNPFVGRTTIPFLITEASNVRLTVFDMLGKEIAVLVNENKEAGEYKEFWNASNMPAGNYLVKLQTTSLADNNTVQMNRTMISIK